MLSRAQIQWRCRRGTKELDLLLQTYLQNAFDPASEPEKQAFLQLLDCQDTELLRYLFGQADADDPRLTPIVSKIRALIASRD